MDIIQKQIQINQNKKVQYNISEGYTQNHTITLIDTENTPCIIRFSRWDDYSFSIWNEETYEEYKNASVKSYEIDTNHPLYIPLLHLLNKDMELIIDDDETKEINQKYLRIYRSERKIVIEFVNNLIDIDSTDRFNVFIKNIGFDIRSKIDAFEKDTKERLYIFFNTVYKLFFEETHQITIEEHLLNTNKLENEEIKKYILKGF